MFGLSTLMTRIAIGLIAAFLILGFFQVRSCQQAKQMAAQSKMDRGQAGAARESAKDAIATQGNVSAAQAAGEALTRTNEKEIRGAKGADAKIDPAVRDAGRAALCRRAAYRDSPQCSHSQ
jgi:hypothetical protein